MSLNSGLDIAIGLALMYLGLSVICTVVNEYIAQMLGWRAKTLAAGIKRLIDDPQLYRAFYHHGLIAQTKDASGTAHPSYLPSATFALALLGSLNSRRPPSTFADAEKAIKALPDSTIRNALVTYLSAAEGDLVRLRDHVASGFDAVMDRLSGVYKRKLQLCSLVVAIVVAIIMNADTFVVTRSLWNDAGLRAQMAAAAPLVVQAYENSGSPDQLKQLQDTLRPLPLGWSRSLPHGLEWVAKVVGLLLTGLAVSLGAPFWFDLLSRFVRVRSTGAKPASKT